MRVFVAALPPPDALDHLEEFLEPRRAAGEDLRWSPAGQWHLTLAFAAAVPEPRLDDLVERLGDAARRRTPFEVAVVGGGAFPDPARAKVVYAGVHGVPPEAGAAAAGPEAALELERLAVGARTALATSGVQVDGARFRPHLTLARTRRPADVTRWLRVLSTYRGPTWAVEELTLVASHLGEGPRGRPRHEILAGCVLGDPPGAGRVPG